MLTPWLHSNLFVAGTTVRSDEMNTKLSGIATALQQYADHINNRLMTLPPNFAGNTALPEKTYINSIPYFNLDGDSDLYSMTAFDAAVQLAIQKAADAAASQAAALASQNASKDSENQALAHRNAAQSSETAAANSAVSASNSATNAANSASSAAGSATAASGSATSAANSAAIADDRATAATASATAAANSAATADNRATVATTNATAAANSAATADNRATVATTNATAAANSATSASSSASSASGSATAAASSATAASGSATSAASSATAAANSATAASGSATSAANSATTADSRATVATNSATAAANSATAAAGSATSANNAKSSAEAAASAAGSSATTAEYWAGQAQTGGQQVYKGLWNASSNTFPSATTMGWTYKISAASTASLAGSNFTDAAARFLNIGDTIIWNAPLSKWDWYADATSGLTPTAGRSDATAGRVVRAGDAGGPSGDYRFAGLDTATVNTATSWNSITGVGVYKEPLRGNNTGGPGGTAGYVAENIQASTTTLVQFAHPISANSGLSSYVRAQVAGSWGAWRQMLDSANLSQFVQSSSTDATTGKLMTAGAFGLGASAGINLANVDDVSLKTGFYNCVTGTTGTKPGGFTTNLVVMVHQYDADQVSQIAVETTTGKIFFRVYALTAWLAWQELWHAGNKPTTISGYGITDAVPATRAVNGLALSSNINLTAANVGARPDTWFPTFAQVTSKPTTLVGFGITDAVPGTRTVNGMALSSNISLSATDVGARPDTWVPSFSDLTSKPTNLAGYGITDAVPSTRTINGEALSANITLTAANVGARADSWVPTFAQVTSKPTTISGYGITDAVPTSRTINGAALSANVTLTAANVGARADTWVPTFAQVSSKPTTLSGYGITDAATQTSLNTARTTNANATLARTGKVTYMGAVSDTTNLTITIPTGYSAGDRIELSLSVATGRVITLSSVTSMDVVSGTAGTSHSITGPIHMNIVMIHDGTKWQLTVS